MLRSVTALEWAAGIEAVFLASRLPAFMIPPQLRSSRRPENAVMVEAEKFQDRNREANLRRRLSRSLGGGIVF